ncbi:hypothetical protein TI39_contig4380g00003 [Zymoseptoria brevis]|uniref:Uncharacterized protein n=1 Tax=Zymoseptoria brevis TaxID=1047168 RepID=A0A0F4G817_9PEZI|nr:hypothetical protein TI39_contig4380g00003 [Zymoseptoria brevis]
MVEASAALYRFPTSDAFFVRAWTPTNNNFGPTNNNFGWGCLPPAWVKDPDLHPDTPVNEELGGLGVELAAERNVTLLLRQISPASLAAVEGATYYASQIYREARRSNICRTFPAWSLGYGYAGDPTSLPMLNIQISQLHSTLSAFTASQIPLIAQLQVSVRVCRRRRHAISTLVAARALYVEEGEYIDAMLEAIRRSVEGEDNDARNNNDPPLNRQSALSQEQDSAFGAKLKAKAAKKNEEERQPRSFHAGKKRFADALSVLKDLDTLVSQSDDSVFKWIDHRPWLHWPWAQGEQQEATARAWRWRCGVLGVRSVNSRAGGPETLDQLFRRMARWARQTGIVLSLDQGEGMEE